MPPRNKIDSMPAATRLDILNLLHRNGFGNYDKIADELKAQGIDVSAAGLRRYGKRFRGLLDILDGHSAVSMSSPGAAAACFKKSKRQAATALGDIIQDMDGAIFQLQNIVAIVEKTRDGAAISEAMKPHLDCLFECMERLMDEEETEAADEQH